MMRVCLGPNTSFQFRCDDGVPYLCRKSLGGRCPLLADLDGRILIDTNFDEPVSSPTPGDIVAVWSDEYMLVGELCEPVRNPIGGTTWMVSERSCILSSFDFGDKVFVAALNQDRDGTLKPLAIGGHAGFRLFGYRYHGED